MKDYKTNPGQAYVITSPGPCKAFFLLPTSQDVTVAEVVDQGQATFIAPIDSIGLTNDQAILTPVFKGAPLAQAKGGGMSDVVVAQMPIEGVDLVSGVSLMVTTPINNLFIKSFSNSGEMRLIFTAESGGVLNVMAPVSLKWLNGNKTHYVNAGDTVAVCICNGLATVGSYS